jgi:hypothetical protein
MIAKQANTGSGSQLGVCCCFTLLHELALATLAVVCTVKAMHVGVLLRQTITEMCQVCGCDLQQHVPAAHDEGGTSKVTH